jgi:sigma-B regulation protein RsbU (phosphoserine phosphatase)
VQKRIYKTLQRIASLKYKDEKELFKNVIGELVKDDKVKISGGRVWHLSPEEKSYRIYYQTGKIKRIKKDFPLTLKGNEELFNRIETERTITSTEVHRELLSKGIFQYSASGFGRKIKIGDKLYYEYLLALSTDNVNNDFLSILNIVSTLLTSKLKERELSATTDTLLSDLDKAQKLQKSLLPAHEYYFHDYCIYGITIPAKTLGGDFFDYLKIGEGENRLGIAVGDAASKGLDAAAEAMYISGAIRMASYFQIKISALMSRLNHLINQIFSDDRFTSLFYGEISEDTKGLFLYANAGHNPPYMLKKRKKIVELGSTGPLLGPAPNSKYETDSVYFNPGDILVIYSDGIVEAANEKYQFFGEARFKRLIKKYSALPPKMMALSILEEVQKFATLNSKYQDDTTLVIIKRKEQDGTK